MNEAQVRTLEQVRQVLAGTQVMEFQAAAGDKGRYAWIASVPKRFDYRHLATMERHNGSISEFGDDMPEVRDWPWTC